MRPSIIGHSLVNHSSDGASQVRGDRTGCLAVVTSDDYNMVMKGVGIAALKARLSEHLRMVRKGRTVTVLDRRIPVARIVPYAAEPIEIRRATRRARDIVSPPAPSRPTDSLAVLLEDRRRR